MKYFYQFKMIFIFLLIVSTFFISFFIYAHAKASWISHGPYGGYITCMIRTSNPEVIYAGTKCGLYKSIDGGVTWMQTSFPPIQVNAIEVAPKVLSQTIDFDDTAAPCSFSETTALSNEYSPLGVVFSGPSPHDGGVILNECSSFSPSGQSSPNFLAFDADDVLKDGGIPHGPETLTFSTPVSYVRVNAAWTLDATISAYDIDNNFIDSDSSGPGGSFWPISVSGKNVAKAVISFS